MRIVCIGGGPAGLYFGALMKRRHPEHAITVVERNKPYDTFGWGVVFSDAMMHAMRAADPESAEEIAASFNHWDDIELLFKGTRQRTSGHGFIGIGRKHLLNILQRRCEALGVELAFEQEVDSDLQFPDADLIIASDGVNSRIRERHADVFKPDMIVRPNRFIWLGVNKRFDAFTFDFRRTEHGWFQAHIYQFDADVSTFIIETTEETFIAHGLDKLDQQGSIDFCQRIFADTLDGAELMTNARHMRGSAWLHFNRLICGAWSYFNGQSHVVLMGDAAHTAHFAIGSGTKLALDDAIELAAQFDELGHDKTHIGPALAIYESIRRVDVARIQNAARNAMEWFEVVGRRYADTMEPEQFFYSMLTRSQRISHENLRLRDKSWLEGYERWFAHRAGVAVKDGERAPLPMLTPFRARGVTLANRIVVSPMAMYSARDGLIGDFHIAHLGARAMGGAGLVFAEMTCVSPEARITPGCLGLWNDQQQAGWKRLVDLIHSVGFAKAGVQLGHSGAKGSTKLAWEGMDQPLGEGGWPLISASALPYLPNGPVPRAMTRADMEATLNDFVTAARRANAAGVDWLELHCAHGYLLSSFLSPLTNKRDDDFGGSHQNRARYPLEVFRAIRGVWPEEKPISVRLSCHDWTLGGNMPDDAEIFATMFKAAGADLIDCSSGQVSKAEKPVYGRLFQTPFSDQIRNQAGIPTIAVGAIFEADHANSILSAGRADLCAIARPHLADAAWTLHEAARVGVTTLPWPKPYHSAKGQYEANLARAAAAMTATPLAGRHALVTGAGTGIGAAIARALVAAGARVSLAGRRREPLVALSEELGSAATLAIDRFDVIDFDAIAAGLERARAAFGPVSILVNNAGEAPSAPFKKTDGALWSRVLAVNLTGVYQATQAVLPDLELYGAGARLINVASTAGLVGYPYVAAYVAAKHGVVGLTRALALEYARSGITFNAVCPGFTETPLVDRAVATIVAKTGRAADAARAELAKSNPQGRLVKPEEVADAVLWLASPGASSISGQAIVVAGGEVMAG